MTRPNSSITHCASMPTAPCNAPTFATDFQLPAGSGALDSAVPWGLSQAVREASEQLAAQRITSELAYGCVDWYLYAGEAAGATGPATVAD